MSHPITPPPELVQQWWHEAALGKYNGADADKHVTSMAAQWGADQELEACVKLLELSDKNAQDFLYSARRPKPPSLKEQALDELHISFDRGYLKKEAADTIRRALEALPE